MNLCFAIPSAEVLEGFFMADKQVKSSSALELIDYPSRFPLKVFGNHSQEFEDMVLTLIKSRCPQTEDFEVSRRSSKAGKYMALTITFTAFSQNQLKQIYHDLYECDDVMMSL
jgi:putative lipoic acid-binding regulatory protein